MSNQNKQLISNMQRRISNQRKEIIRLRENQVKRGEWGFDGFCWTCSECDMYGVKTYKYCPHCGAKMKSEDTEEVLK